MTTSTRKKRRIIYDTDSMDQQSVNRRQLLDLPFELIIEIFQRAGPAELLYLARTTKGFRAFLLNRCRSQYIWKMAIGNVPDLPLCPDYLSEPAYTHLAFVPVCHGCFKQCHTIEWELRMRCCQKCYPKMHTSRTFSIPDITNATMRKAYAVWLPAATKCLVLRNRGMNVVSMSLPSSNCRIDDWEGLLKRAKNTRLGTEKFAENEDKVWAPIREHARLCRTWEFKRLTDEVAGRKVARVERANDIKRNLKALGWTDDMYYTADFFKLRAVSKPELLTPSEWSKISPKLIESLPKVRLKHIAGIYRDRLVQFRISLSHIQGSKAHPNPVDIFLHPDVRNVLESDTNTEMSHEMISQRLGPILPGLIQQWYDDAVGALTSYTEQQLGSESDVDLSNVMFKCTECKERIGFNGALTHKHLYPKYISNRRKREHMLKQESRIYEGAGREVYSGTRNFRVLRVDKSMSRKKDSSED